MNKGNLILSWLPGNLFHHVVQNIHVFAPEPYKEPVAYPIKGARLYLMFTEQPWHSEVAVQRYLGPVL